MKQLNNIQKEELYKLTTEIVALQSILANDICLDLDSYIEILEKVNHLKSLKEFLIN